MGSCILMNRPRLTISFPCVSSLAVATGARADMDATAQLALGNPSNATGDPAHPANCLISRPRYALACIRDYGEARWVSLHLNASDIGNSGRGKYRIDGDLIETAPVVYVHRAALAAWEPLPAMPSSLSFRKPIHL